jgi:uncharacterized membrane protein
MIQNRFRSPILWAAIFAQLLVILKITGVWQLVGVPETDFTAAVAAVIQLLVIVGVLNNPTDPEGW